MNNKTFFSFCMISFCFCLHAMENCETKALLFKRCCSSNPNDRLREILTSNKSWREKRYEIVATIKNGADPKVKEYVGYQSKNSGLKDYGNSALTYAIRNDDCVAVSFLLKKGAKVEDDESWSYRPLFFDAQSEEMATLLINQGMVDITCKEKGTKNTILHHLAKSGKKSSSSLFRYYLERGLNPHEKNNDQQTALDILIYRAFDDETREKFLCLLEYLNKDCGLRPEELSETTKERLRTVEEMARLSLKNAA